MFGKWWWLEVERGGRTTELAKAVVVVRVKREASWHGHVPTFSPSANKKRSVL